MNYPVLSHKHYAKPSYSRLATCCAKPVGKKVLLKRAYPQCVLDPDGDIVQHLIAIDQASVDPHWACYHTKLYRFIRDGIEYGIVPHVVGAPFAVLLVEELFACGCQLLVSITSAGQITPVGAPPYFVLIERALRDEGTSYHYLPPSDYSDLGTTVRSRLQSALVVDLDRFGLRILQGSTWTTDAPLRETETAIAFARQQNILGVEMEAATLYAYAQASGNAIVCFAHITNQIAQIEGDFEKGEAQGSLDALRVIAWAACSIKQDSTRSHQWTHV